MGKKENQQEHYRASALSSLVFKRNGNGRNGHRPFLLFARSFFKHPKMVGWILPSSHFLVDEVLRRIDWNKAQVIVEYGPGMGAFTTGVLKRMRPDAKLVAMETSDEFVHFLKSSLHDDRLRVIHESATEIDTVLPRLGFPKADYVISGIPFRPLPHPLRDAIVRKTHAVLRPEGRFLVYQFTSHALPYLNNVFGHVSRDFELLNILPAQLFCCAR